MHKRVTTALVTLATCTGAYIAGGVLSATLTTNPADANEPTGATSTISIGNDGSTTQTPTIVIGSAGSTHP